MIRRKDNLVDSLKEKIDAKLSEGRRANKKTEDILNNYNQLYLSYFKPIYLIFDQFEELFIFGDEDEAVDFFQTIHTLLNSEHEIRILLSMREDYIAYITDYERIISYLFETRLRIEKMYKNELDGDTYKGLLIFSDQMDEIEKPACPELYFVSGIKNLKAMAILQSPLVFRIRKIFVLKNFLDRA